MIVLSNHSISACDAGVGIVVFNISINIEFASEGMTTQKGDVIDGYYDRSQNVIVFNPKSKKSFESLLIHELTHSLEKTQKYEKLMRTALAAMPEAGRNSIMALYHHLGSYNEQLYAAAAAAASLQSCPTLCNPIDTAHQAPPSLGFSRQEHWSGLPFPSPRHKSEK